MSFIFWLSFVFLLAVNVSSEVKANEGLSLSDENAINAEILANVTKVNKELKYLIKKFEKLIKTQESGVSPSRVKDLVEELTKKLKGKNNGIKIEILSGTSEEATNEIIEESDTDSEPEIIILSKNDFELNEPNSKDTIGTENKKVKASKYLKYLLDYKKKLRDKVKAPTWYKHIEDKLKLALDEDNQAREIALRVEDNDEAIKGDKENTLALRQAYGDACLKLVVQKCKKALRQTGKDLNEALYCTKKCLTSFQGCAAKSCEEEFSSETNRDSGNDLIKDYTRQGYLSAACLPESEEEKKAKLRSYDLLRNNLNEHEHEMNTLRDRFEMACQKAMATKCVKACEFTYTQACILTSCSTKTMEEFKKSCARNCRIAYSKKEESDSDSSISSDTSD